MRELIFAVDFKVLVQNVSKRAVISQNQYSMKTLANRYGLMGEIRFEWGGIYLMRNLFPIGQILIQLNRFHTQ